MLLNLRVSSQYKASSTEDFLLAVKFSLQTENTDVWRKELVIKIIGE